MAEDVQKKQMNLGLNLLRVCWAASWLCCWLIAQIPGRFSKELVQ